MYLRLRKRRKPSPQDARPQEADDDAADSTPPGTGAQPARPAQPAQPAQDPSSGDWVEAQIPSGEPSGGTDVSTSGHPNRGKARESSRGSR